MTTLSKHQPGAGQGVEFQSRQSHTGTKGAGECEKLFIPLLTCSHMKTHIILWKMRNVNLGMCLKVKQCSFVKLRLPNPIRCEFVKMCYLCFTSSLYKHCFKSYPTFSMTVSRKTVGLEGYADPTFISPALCCGSVVDLLSLRQRHDLKIITAPENLVQNVHTSLSLNICTKMSRNQCFISQFQIKT